MSKEFEKELAQLAKLIEETRDFVATEEATKMSFVLPFFKALGYNYSDPREIIAEYTADINNKNMDKVDYAVMEDGQPIILVECKHWNDKLENHAKQLFKYFVSTPAKFAILTNGIEYLFYTDLEETNKLDQKPFLRIDLLDIKSHALKELSKFRKEIFNVSEILTTAEELKYTNSIINLLSDEYLNPSDDFVKYILSKVYEGVRTQNTIEKFRSTLANSFKQFVSDLMSEKLETAFKSEPKKEESISEAAASIEQGIQESGDSIVTTEEEIEAFYIVKSILSEIREADQVSHKKTNSYLGILYENKTTKWILRLRFNNSSKSFIFPTEISDDRVFIENVNELYKYKELIKNSCKRFLE